MSTSYKRNDLANQKLAYNSTLWRFLSNDSVLDSVIQDRSQQEPAALRMYWLCQQQIFLLLFGKKVQFQISKTNSSPRNDMSPI